MNFCSRENCMNYNFTLNERVILFCHSSHDEFSQYFFSVWPSVLSMFCRPTLHYIDISSSHPECFRNFICRLMVSFQDFCGALLNEFSWYFVACLAVSFIDILALFSLWIISIFCLAFHGKCCPYLFRASDFEYWSVWRIGCMESFVPGLPTRWGDWLALRTSGHTPWGRFPVPIK